MQYVLKDHQGSFAALVNEKSGTEYFSFDAWGRRRNPSNWSYDNMPASFGSTRGFTMHACPERSRRAHLDEFKLINMNGRVYDPLVGRFISPDPFVQRPDYSQSYNRYSYAFNNPLRFSDPSGFFAEGDSTIRPTAELPFLPAKNKPSYRPKASTNTDNTSLGSGVKETETTLPIPYQQSKLSMDAEENANEAPQGGGGNTFEEARFWYQFGGGAPMDVNLNSIDLSRVRMSDFNSRGLATVRLAGKHFSNLNDALVHGTITIQRIGNTNQAKIALNSDPATPQLNGQPAGMYDFEMHTWGKAINWVRNPETFIGGLINGLMPIPITPGGFIYVGGTGYPIYYNGTVTIKQ